MNRRPRNNDVMPLVAAIIAISIAGYFGYHIFIDKEESPALSEEVESQEETGANSSSTAEDPEPETIALEETPEHEGGHYIKKVPIIERQQTYITIPTQYQKGSPPTIIVYSHGQDQEITVYESEEFMRQMVQYGEFFTQHNYIFAASNMHGNNWGSDEAVQDMQNMVEWIHERYETSPKVYLLGFSMGGLPTFEYAFAHPNKVEKIASLAGTTKSESWTNDELSKLKGKDIKIWHGNDDVNVLYRYSEQFVERCEELDVPVELRTVDGVGHWDVDWEYHEEVLEFFDG